MDQEYDIAVLGLGGIGSAAAYWLARSGAKVIGLEQFELGHARGESEDHSRIIRLSYHTPGYVRFAQDAYRTWDEVELDANEQIVTRCGSLDLWPSGSVLDHEMYTSSMTAAGVNFETLKAGEVMRRWPQFHLEQDVIGVYQADGGLVSPFIANRIHRQRARLYGATLLDETPVERIEYAPGAITLYTPRGAIRVQQLVVTAGPWSNRVLEMLGHSLPLTVTQEQVTYYATPHLAEFSPERFPVWLWMDEPSFYGFPAYGEAATKAAWDAGGRETTADTRSFEPDPHNRAAVTDFLRRVLPRAVGPELYTKTCLYTMPPDRDFVIDRLPGAPEILVAIGAGHAFKFASVIGRSLSELALKGQATSDLSAFRFDRPIMTELNPTRNFLL